ncbi:hypothetical protein ACWD6P_22850 [Streptomyces sp. NPDC002446]
MSVVGRRRFSALAISAVLVSGCLGGCSVLRSDPEPTMNVNQAVKRIDAVLDGTFKSIRPRIKWRDGPAEARVRKNSFTNTDNGEVSVGRTRYVRTKVSKAKLTELMETVRSEWTTSGYEIGEVHSQEPTFSGTAPDGCIIRFGVTGFGSVKFSVSVGAVSPGTGGPVKGEEGGKFPKAPNGGPDYTPDVRDPYWSK